MTAKRISNGVYALGIAVFLALVCLVAFGANLVPNPDAMIPWSMRDIAFVGLAAGSVPMLFACMSVYKYNRIRETAKKKRNFFLIFLPCFLCGVCLLVCVGFLIVMLAMGFMDSRGINYRG